jgi:hypothetical protein
LSQKTLISWALTKQQRRGMKAFWDDFRFAQTAGVAVEVHLLSGEKLMTGVHEVHEDEGFVTLFAPQTYGDETTTRKVDGDLIASVAVTDVQWS